jgi:hypothetical protein
MRLISPAEEVSRRSLFRVLPAAGTACFGCLNAQTAAHSPSEKADITWEDLFRFAYRKDLIPMLKGLSARLGKERTVELLKEIMSEAAGKPRAQQMKDLTFLAAGMKGMSPLYQHALVGEVLAESPQLFEYKVTSCLWAKSFREEGAGELGYAMICYPDYAVATSFSPKIRLQREKTLMQGHECCHFRYTMEG